MQFNHIKKCARKVSTHLVPTYYHQEIHAREKRQASNADCMCKTWQDQERDCTIQVCLSPQEDRWLYVFKSGALARARASFRPRVGRCSPPQAPRARESSRPLAGRCSPPLQGQALRQGSPRARQALRERAQHPLWPGSPRARRLPPPFVRPFSSSPR